MVKRINRIDGCFKELKKKKQKALVIFITAGYPSLKVTEKLVLEFEKAGVDIIELGVPFSDPMADGPVIQFSSFEALKNNTRLTDIINLVGRLRRKVNIPLLLMTYYNPVFSFGEDRFIKEAIVKGVDGVIIPDLPPDEGKDFVHKAQRAGLYSICFIAPTTSLKRMKIILKLAKGFIYYVSLTGVTGARKSLSYDLKENVTKIKKYTQVPVCVGFGVSCREQVKQVSKFSDGVIVGSAIINKIKENIKNPYLIKEAVNFVRGLKKA
ncbi:MAG: tryptophan synthase subunit alpha [Candidatus Omnitrophica bacterium]|nr:tryptophan synthase subunit alpha [Candidatus Omnitrophota bacterium]